jgi:hypothetical protein
MGRAARASTKPQSVQLTEAEFFKLAKLSQDVQLASIAARQAVAEKEVARNLYMDVLTKTYPDLDFKAGNYVGNDETWTLTPQEKER